MTKGELLGTDTGVLDVTCPPACRKNAVRRRPCRETIGQGKPCRGSSSLWFSLIRVFEGERGYGGEGGLFAKSPPSPPS